MVSRPGATNYDELEERMSETFPVKWSDPSDADLSWEWDDMHFPHALPPLSGEYVCKVIGEGFNYRYERADLPMTMRVRILNGYAYFAVRFAVPESERPRVLELARERRRAQSKIVRKYWEVKVLPTLLATYQWMHGASIETAPRAEVADAWAELWTRMPPLFGLHFMTNAGSYQSLDDLADLYEAFIPGARPGEAFTLVQGLLTDLQRVERDLYLLAEHARALPDVAQWLLRDTTDAFVALPHVDGGAEFLNALRTFLTSHGHLGQPFDDLMSPSWGEEPAFVLVEIRKRLRHRPEDPEARRQQLAVTAAACADKVRALLRDRPEAFQQFETALALAREAGPLTEIHNYWLDRMLHANARRFVVRVGTRLVHAGVLARAEDVFFLYVDEVHEVLQHPRDLQQTLIDRKAEHRRWSTIRPPRQLGAAPDPAAPPSRFDAQRRPQQDPGRLQGIGASAGTARGTARVVLSLEDFGRVERGDVLICPSSNPSWVPLFAIIAGLVTDTGSVTSHAAVVAREFGVPAVVGTGEATQRVRDGQSVEVDGTAGEVRLL